jgi:multidrug efflux pump subunit AcrA (membrane-fusion protein)
MNDLVLTDMGTALAAAKPEYRTMLANIQERLPAIARDTSNFYKSHSQFMQVALDVTAITPIRSIKHTLAEIDRTKSALQEAYISARKKQVELKRKEAELAAATEALDREMLEIEILEIQSQLDGTQNHVNGALRKMNFFANQHKQLLEKVGRDEITEEDYEREECRYHIMTCMKQGLNAARSRNGVIDEGNMIYLFDLGINAAQAQAEVFAYLNLENELISQGKAPTHEMTVQWLEACADKWADDPAKFAAYRGFSLLDEQSLTNVKQLTSDGE